MDGMGFCFAISTNRSKNQSTTNQKTSALVPVAIFGAPFLAIFGLLRVY